ncbi:MAG: hypothetical protein DCC58_05075 [Chloroflexi bacterium]|nr:MAG: hypothetical protein DCC58_05075 [Chloroflexota bacterium]
MLRRLLKRPKKKEPPVFDPEAWGRLFDENAEENFDAIMKQKYGDLPQPHPQFEKLANLFDPSGNDLVARSLIHKYLKGGWYAVSSQRNEIVFQRRKGMETSFTVARLAYEAATRDRILTVRITRDEQGRVTTTGPH